MNNISIGVSLNFICLLAISSLSACVSCQTPEQQRLAIIGATAGQHIGHFTVENYGNVQSEHLGAAAGALGGAMLGCMAALPPPVRPVVFFIPSRVRPGVYFEYSPACRRFEVQEYVNGWPITSYETWCYLQNGSRMLY